jgi:hypothetical protein
MCLEQSAHGRGAGRSRLAVADAGARGATGHQSVITDGNKHAELQRLPVPVDSGCVMACVVPLKRTPTLPPPTQAGTHPGGCQHGWYCGEKGLMAKGPAMMLNFTTYLNTVVIHLNIMSGFEYNVAKCNSIAECSAQAVRNSRIDHNGGKV